MNYTLVFPGEAPAKKNARKQAYTRKSKKTGLFEPLNFPMSYYSKEYNEWAWKAIQYLQAWKGRNLTQLIEEPTVCTMWFFRSTPFNITGNTGKGSGQTIDLQNLYDTILDTLAGNTGLKIPKYLHMEHEDYKILSDDSFAFIKSHGASHIFFDPTNPRTEVYISPFKLTMLAEAMKLFHPDINRPTPEQVYKELQSFDFVEKQKQQKSEDIKIDFNLDNFLKGG